MIWVNGRELDEHGLHARVEARKRAGLYDDRLLALLERDVVEEVEEHVFSMIQVVYDLQRVLEDSGARLEPPADLSTGVPGEEKGRLGSFARRMQTRFIRAVNEGYVQQQEKCNTFLTKAVDISYRQLCGALGGLNLSEVAERRDEWLSERPAWSPEISEAVAGLGGAAAVLVGIPGLELPDMLQDAGRLILAVDSCDAAVAEAQARFIPACYHPQPLEALKVLDPEDLDLAVLAFPECLTGEELGGWCLWAGSRLKDGGVALVALNRGFTDTLRSDDGFVRYWPRRTLSKMLRRGGMRADEWRAGGRVFLKGEKGA